MLAAVLLLHHIEGVCKPRSAAGRVVDGFVAGVVQRGRAERLARVQDTVRRAREQAEAEELAKAEQAEALQAGRRGQRPQPAPRPLPQRDPVPPTWASPRERVELSIETVVKRP